MNKPKSFLVEFYWLGIIITLLFSELSYSQQRPNNYHVRPATPESGYVFYERNDSLFVVFVDGREVYINIFSGDRAKTPEFGWITDSIKWVPATYGTITFDDTDECREHDWVYGPVTTGAQEIHFVFGSEYFSCSKLNQGKHCNEHESSTREKICRICLRSEVEREMWFQHYVAPPMDEFQRLKEKQRAKQ